MTKTASRPPKPPLQAVLYPAYTLDYRVGKGKTGLGLFANRDIAEKELVFDESLDYLWSDVVDGDQLLFDRHDEASKKGKTNIPPFFPLSRDVLLRTHGTPGLIPDPSGNTAGTVSWRLEVPGMLVNHSCEPNMRDYPPTDATAEGYATRDIAEGEELTSDYVLQYYDHGPFFEKCMCGAPNCRGKMMGFKALTDEEKKKLFPAASPAVKAMHLADTGQGPPVKKEQRVFPPRSSDGSDVPRLVCPGPSCASAEAALKKDSTGRFGLYAAKDFKVGKVGLEFWVLPWPMESNKIDMVFPIPLSEGDPPEGTVVRVDAADCAMKNRKDQFKFSGFELFTAHSCDPNLYYKDEESDDEEDWRKSRAAKNIKAGDRLTVDYNSYLWDRTGSNAQMKPCTCGAAKCTGAAQGFKFLPKEARQERKVMSWKRKPPPHKAGKVVPGEALSEHVLVNWRKDPELKADAPRDESSCLPQCGIL